MSRLRGRIAGALGRASGTDRLRVQLGGIESRLVRDAADPRAAEFSVFSQFGEDGIVEYLAQRVPVENETFVEFGVEDYSESNTRFLLEHRNWRGLILDGGDAHARFVHEHGLDWRHWIDARTAFVDRDNIDGLITEAGVGGDIGLLSIDIDGNDLWVLERISAVSPRILAVEYNSTFGPEAEVTIPYDPGFRRTEAHWSNLYWGASIAALDRVAKGKGYVLVAGNSAGNNAFWVREDVAGGLEPLTPARAWAPSRFRESRGPDGALTYVGDHAERLALIRDLPVADLASGETVAIGRRFGV
jgi:hypothetical protein